jgi:hypothetical protein
MHLGEQRNGTEQKAEDENRPFHRIIILPNRCWESLLLLN